MSVFTDLINPMQPCESATAFLLKKLNIKFTVSHLRKELHEHPNYPSLLAIADVIGISYNISSAPLRINTAKLQELPIENFPVLAHMKAGKRGQVFCVVTGTTDTHIQFHEPGSKVIQELLIEAFDNRFLGTILLTEATDAVEEDNFKHNIIAEKKSKILYSLFVYLIPIFTILSFIYIILTHTISVSIFPILYTAITLSGLLVCVLLVWHEIDSYNPALKQICQASTKINCSAVLDSKGSKIFNISWSTIGLLYFGGMSLALLSGGIVTSNILSILSYINLFALPYTFYSIYYQWKVLEQWCALCLIIQGIFISQFMISIVGNYLTQPIFHTIFTPNILTVIFSFLFITILVLLLIPALQKAKLYRDKLIDLQRLKRNPLVFDALLQKEPFASLPEPDMGITIGNPTGKYKIIKVCNPYCGPCATAHPIIHSLINNNPQICVQIIFSATIAETDYRRDIVAHFMALQQEVNSATINQALDDWYNSKEKDYANFILKYPIQKDGKTQYENINKMAMWVETNSVLATPTFFICSNTQNNNSKFYQLPKIYKPTDLKYLFESN